MLLLLLSSLFVLINGVPVALQPQLMELRQSNSTTKDPEGNLDLTNLKRGFDAKSLIEELADADPAKVQEVITLVDIMLQEAQADLDRLISASTDADNAYDIAVSNYDAAVVSQVQGVADRLEAERLEAEAVATAQSAKDVAEGAKTGARDNLDAEKTRLESEIASLEQVLSILNGLITTSGSSCQISSESPLGVSYDGNVAITRAGNQCQKWTMQSPHTHTRTSSNYPGTGLGDHNYCRNPDSEPNGVWCYTTNPAVRWEYCDVPYC